MRYILIGLMFVLTGCDQPVRQLDQNLRREIFKECMRLLPAGPQKTMYNDWAEVVSECESVAYYQALTCIKNCSFSAK